ncbi:hypothetical protein P43SY_008096 [Pythium insidiosum]|uniref:Leishmanolysin-like peptidase n=1 Tax=Pythium insidiosum TaxID=114742 RepID=A0AAD5LBU4_PYTIN|nr:hypothetical protein P43SY_008096 [Pythium insidiosum]
MGNVNAPSDAAEDAALSRVSRLRDDLADMERAVAELHRRPQIDLRAPHLVHAYGVDVGSDPAVFRFSSLLPGRDYRVVFDGVHRDDVLTCSASFRTPSLERPPALRCAVVSADNVYEVDYAEPSLWSTMRRMVAAPDDPESVDRKGDRLPLVLHLGGQVAMQRQFDKAWAMMVRQTECIQPPAAMSGPGDAAFTNAWADVERQVMEILRSAYRTQWMLADDKRFVLANASNLMMWSDWDVYPAFTTSKTFIVDHSQPTIEMQVLRTVMRCARRLYHEYQRALWDDDIHVVIERDNAMRAVAEEALATTAKIHSLAVAIPLAESDLELQKKRREIEGARRAERHLRALEAEKARFEKELVSFNQLIAPQRGEEFMVVIGDICILMIDMRGNRIEPGGSQLSDNEILSNVQWDYIEQELERPDLKTLIYPVAPSAFVISFAVEELQHIQELPVSGVANADFILYVRAVKSKYCTDSVLAYASSCQKDQYDRPTFGMANFCPDQIKTDPRDYESQLSTAMHEITHALGFSSQFYAYMRNPDGTPRTPRDENGDPPPGLENGSYCGIVAPGVYGCKVKSAATTLPPAVDNFTSAPVTPTPETPTTAPEAPTSAPETPAPTMPAPETPTTAPEAPTSAPETPAPNTPAPETPTTAPEAPTSAPETPAPTTPAPETPTTAPEAPTSAPETPAPITPAPSEPGIVSSEPPFEVRCNNGSVPMSVEGVPGIFCAVEPVCVANVSTGNCPGATVGLAWGSSCGLVQTGVYGCKPNTADGVPVAVSYPPVRDCSNSSAGSSPVSVVGEGTYCASEPVCVSSQLGNCPRAQEGLSRDSVCVKIPTGVYGCVLPA